MNKDFEKRHKCHYCGAVRYESRMKKLSQLEARDSGSQFGNDTKCWCCISRCWGSYKLVDRPLEI